MHDEQPSFDKCMLGPGLRHALGHMLPAMVRYIFGASTRMIRHQHARFACAGWGLLVTMLSMLAGAAVEWYRLRLFGQGSVLTHVRCHTLKTVSKLWM